ncbi:hypothetical protein ACMGDM_16690 [Sphingomonas sp. DT-51]|uniref:hypothetical protein n=1 Tax=Sphingomonas sp. DT-51 TaxID=3396165 RepID=UPI003F1B435E
MEVFAILMALVGAAAFEGMVLLYRRGVIPVGPLLALASSILLTLMGLTLVGLTTSRLVTVNQVWITDK